jgi:hypothetical protein
LYRIAWPGFDGRSSGLGLTTKNTKVIRRSLAVYELLWSEQTPLSCRAVSVSAAESSRASAG